MNEDEYIKNEFERAINNLYNSKRKSFGDRDKLAKWFVDKLKDQNFRCFHCDTSIFDINKLIDANLLKTRKVRRGGKRGPVLEIDKDNEEYDPATCVLSCYYCNNDKSYITKKLEYKDNFGKNRKLYFDKLLKKI